MSEIEIEFNDSRKGVKLRLSGDKSTVDSYLKQFGYDDAIKNSMQSPAASKAETSPTEQSGMIDMPEKPADVTSISQYILKLMYGPWGASGRTSNDMMEVARSHGIAVSINTLSGILHGLAKSGKIRRIRNPGETQWVYSPPTSVAMANR